MFIVVQIFCLMLFSSCSDAQLYEEADCSCVCPGLKGSASVSSGFNTFYQDNNVEPEECNCSKTVLPSIANRFKGSLLMYCIQCDCPFETRNTTIVMAELYENRRCSCVCPGLEGSANISRGFRTFYQDNHVAPEECNCNSMVLPRIASRFNGSLLTYCTQCDCHFETRNTTIVMIVVVSLITVISVLMLYMGCLYILKKIVKQRQVIANPEPGNDELLMGLLDDSGLPRFSDEEN